MFGAQARFAAEQVTAQGEGTEYERVGDEGSRITFTFCGRCGATVHYRIEAMDGMVIVPVGAFAEPGFPAPTFSVYEERMHGWVTMPADIAHMA